MTKDGSSKSLKDQNRWQLWLIIAANWLLFYTIVQSGALAVSGIKALFLDATNLVPIGFALIITSVANGQLSATTKARLVFMRWKDPLPGSRAFSRHMASDPRIDAARLKKALGNKMPSGPTEENSVWYRFYKELEHDPAVTHIHREFLFTRDYTALAFLFLIVFGGISLFIIFGRVTAIYVGLMLGQFIVVRQAAATYGTRFVCTVLARKSAKAPAKSASRAG